MKRDEGDVVIMRSGGYVSDEQWIAAIRAALKAGRVGTAVDAAGRPRDLKEFADG